MGDKNNVNTFKIREYTKENGKFKEGNPGKPKGAISYSKKLDEALKEIETEEGKSLFKRFIRRAFTNDKVLVAAMKKFVSDKSHTELETAEPIEIVIHRAKDES